jgi:hypothetical protein
MAEGQASPTKYILIGCAIALALGVCGVGSCLALVGGAGFFAWEKTEAPAAEARKFVEALGKGDAKGALEHASARYRARTSPERLGAALAASGVSLAGIQDVTLPSRGISDRGAQIAGVVTTAAGQVGVELFVVEEGGLWRVDQVSLNGEPLPAEPEGPPEGLAPPSAPVPPSPPAPPAPPVQ